MARNDNGKISAGKRNVTKGIAEATRPRGNTTGVGAVDRAIARAAAQRLEVTTPVTVPGGPPQGQQQGYPGGKGPGAGSGFPASFHHDPYQGKNIPGLHTQGTFPWAAEPHAYWKDFFTMPDDRGAGFRDWTEVPGACISQSSVVTDPTTGDKVRHGRGLGPPRVVVLPHPSKAFRYILHIYFASVPFLSRHGQFNPRLEYATSENGESWTSRGPVPDFNAFGKSWFKSRSGYHPPYWIQDMAVVYGWTGTLLEPKPLLRFYFEPRSQWGHVKSPLQCATTTDGINFTLVNESFPPRTGDNGWVSTPHAIRMSSGNWWMYYVGNLPEKEYKDLPRPWENPVPPLSQELDLYRPYEPRPHHSRVQVSMDRGINWSSKYPASLTYRKEIGLPNTNVDPDVVYLSGEPRRRFRMFFKGEFNFEVSESTDGLNWWKVGPLAIGKHNPLKTDWQHKTKTLEANYTPCFDPTVVRVKSAEQDKVFLYYNRDGEIHRAEIDLKKGTP